MRRAFASSLFSLVLISTFLWGGCISCEQYFMWAGAKSCCAPDGHCKTNGGPAKQLSNRECNLIALDHQKSINHHVDFEVIAVAIASPIRIVESFGRWHGTSPIVASPPDLRVLHSTFLI